ncbi:MAG: efflux RND transporter periplasmic adaptor subunit [Xanthobacteraceae bacterium]
MDERTSFIEEGLIESGPKTRHPLRKLVLSGLLVTMVVVVAVVGFRLGRRDYDVPAWLPSSVAELLQGSPAARKSAPSGEIIYYRDPDGRPFYSSEPKNRDDGRPYSPVFASEDLSFEERPPATTAAEAGRRILYYRNPMGLPDTSPSPKKDSMGMDYLPVYEGEDTDDGTIKLSPGKVQRAGVRSEPVVRRILARIVRVPGTVKLDERRVSVVSMRADSFIERVENVTTGDLVKKGQRLLEVFSPDVNVAAAQLISNPGFEGSRRRLQNLNVPAEVIAEIEQTRRVPLSIVWSAPRDGIVLERNATEGMKAPSGQVLFRLADISLIWILADVPERDIGSIPLGTNVALRARSLPDRVFSGKVTVVYPQINPETRSARVRIEIDNKDGALLPEMYVDVDLTSGPDAPVLSVPESAVIDSGTRKIVIIDKGDGRFEPREVKTGIRGDEFVEIRDGIEEGNQVVIAANFLIDAESNLRAALRSMNTEPAQ